MRQLLVLAALSALLAAVPAASTAADATGPIKAIGVENEYADVLSQIGGGDVEVQAILTDPNTDPHSFEASARIAREIADAQLIVVNGAGYDDWVYRIMSAARRPGRRAINVQELLRLSSKTPNPHLWYDPRTMPAVASAIGAALAELEPARATVFRGNAARFIASLGPWDAAILAFKRQHDKTPIAVSEPVANYLLEAMGFDIETPASLQTAIMNGTDPSPQDMLLQNRLLSGRTVRLFAYDRQVTNNVTNSFLQAAAAARIPVVGVYETMPSGYTYQSWMLAEVAALGRAVTGNVSTQTLQQRH